MSMLLELTPDEEAQLTAAAQQEGVEPVDLLRRWMKQHLPSPGGNKPADPLLALFAAWDEEDAALTDEEVQRENQEWKEFKHAINSERDRSESRRVF